MAIKYEPIFTKKNSTLLMALAVISLLSGCGEHKKPVTQVAAKVDQDELTVGQVNSLFSKVQSVPGKSVAQVRHEVLDNLIEQQLVIRQAISKKMDRDPAVMQAIEEAKRNILANAYLEKIRASTPKITAEEVSQYYAAHPDLFAQRRIFSLRELDIAVQPGLVDVLRDQIEKGVAIEAIANGLKAKNIPFSANASTHSAEETPFEILSKIVTLKEGQMTLIESKNSLTILQVMASKMAPVDEKTASASIQQFLTNNKTKDEVNKELSSLKKIAKIEYFGEFLPGAEPVADAVRPATEGGAASGVAAHTTDMAKAVSNLK